MDKMSWKGIVQFVLVLATFAQFSDGQRAVYVCKHTNVNGSEFDVVFKYFRNGDTRSTGLTSYDASVHPNTSTPVGGAACTTQILEEDMYTLQYTVDVNSSLPCGIVQDTMLPTIYKVAVAADGTSTLFTFACNTSDLQLPNKVTVDSFATGHLQNISEFTINKNSEAKFWVSTPDDRLVNTVKVGEYVKLRWYQDITDTQDPRSTDNLGTVFHTAYPMSINFLIIKIYTLCENWVTVQVKLTVNGDVQELLIYTTISTPAILKLRFDSYNPRASFTKWRIVDYGLKILSLGEEIGVILYDDQTSIVVQPDDVLGKQYRLLSFGSAICLIIGTEDSTTVAFDLSNYNTSGLEIDGRNISFASEAIVTIHEHKAIELRCYANCEGLIIKSSKRVAVILGFHGRFIQIPETNKLYRNFIIPRSPGIMRTRKVLLTTGDNSVDVEYTYNNINKLLNGTSVDEIETTTFCGVYVNSTGPILAVQQEQRLEQQFISYTVVPSIIQWSTVYYFFLESPKSYTIMVTTSVQNLNSISMVTPSGAVKLVQLPNHLTSLISTDFAQSSPISCDFENANICTYSQETTDNFDWTRATGPTSSDDTGPNNDHTFGTSQGHYMYIEASDPRQLGDIARLMSPTFIPSGAQCLEFWYNMYGSSTGTLNVYFQIGSNKGSPVFTIQGNQGPVWRRAQVEITQSTSISVVFEGICGSSYTSDIAIDDISVTPGTCAPSSSISCDFENANICTYSQDTTDNFDWTRATGPTSSAGTGPNNDHTFGTSQGHYMYIEASDPRQLGDIARLMSPTFTPSGAQCLEFWYNMNGNAIGTLNVYFQVGSNIGSPLFTIQGNQGPVWRRAQVEITQSTSISVVFEGICGSSFSSDIAIDDISVKPGTCAQSSPISCDFEDTNICTYSQDTTDTFDWTRATGPTMSVGTGPNTDHTFGTSQGHYMYIETSNPRQLGDIARLMSPTFTPSGAQCLEFWYNMNGDTIGTLNVYFQVGSNKGSPVFTIQGNQGPVWRRAQVEITQSTSISVVFEGICGSSFTSDIAIDDISVTPGTCGVSYNDYQVTIVVDNTLYTAGLYEFNSGDTGEPFGIYLLEAKDDILNPIIPFGMRFPCVHQSTGDIVSCDHVTDNERSDDSNSLTIRLKPKEVMVSDTSTFSGRNVWTLLDQWCNTNVERSVLPAVSSFTRVTSTCIRDRWMMETDVFKIFRFRGSYSVFFRLKLEICVVETGDCDKPCTSRTKRSTASHHVDLELSITDGNVDKNTQGKPREPCESTIIYWIPHMLLLMIIIIEVVATSYFLTKKWKLKQS